MRHNCKDCNNHTYRVTPNAFKQGSRCPKCFGSNKLTQEEWIDEVFSLVGNEYTSLGVYVNDSTKILMRHNCKDCNNHTYMVTPNDFKNKNSRCPKCKESKGEKAISKYLKKKGIIHEIQYKIEECRNVRPLPFDNSIFENGILKGLIEFDGKQHFKAINHYGGYEQLLKNINHDVKKTYYCKENQIPLLRIKYTQLENIDEILDDFVNNTSKYIHNHYYGMTEEEYYEECLEEYNKERLAIC
jgi:predicted Zn-ribbon and HTH transcriptional regulator